MVDTNEPLIEKLQAIKVSSDTVQTDIKVPFKQE